MKSITRFLKRKRKRILYFLIGMFFSFIFIANNFIICRADEDLVTSSYYFGDYNFLVSMSDEGANSKTVFDNHDGWVSNIDRGGTMAFVSSHLNSDMPFLRPNFDFLCIATGDSASSYQPVYITGVQDYNNIALFDCWGNPTIVSSEPFSITIGSNYDSYPAVEENGYYYYSSWFNGYRGLIPNFRIVSKKTGSLTNQDTWQNMAVDWFGPQSNTKIFNDIMNDHLESTVDSYYNDSIYYNSYLKDFSVQFLPSVPKFSYINSINQLGGNSRIRVNYNLNNIQSANLNNYFINEKGVYNLTFSFYKYSDELINSLLSFSDYAYKAQRYNKCVDQYINTLQKYNLLSISLDTKTSLYYKYVCNVSFTSSYEINVNTNNYYEHYLTSIFKNGNFLNLWNFLSTSKLGIINEGGTLYSGYDVAADIVDSNIFDYFSTPVQVGFIDLFGNTETISISTLSDINALMGKIYVNNDTLSMTYKVNDSDKTYNVIYDFLDSDKTPVVDNKGIDEKPQKDETITNDNPIISNDDNSNNQVITNNTPGNGTGYGNISQIVTVNQNATNSTSGLSWSDRPMGTENASLGGSVNTGYDVLGSLTQANGFVQVIASYFTFIPQQFWSVILAVISFVGVIVLFKIVLWII